ncbi:MAG: hypothetical protein OXG19_01615 [Chloroflexi bacterium]|nr:hypothetical protein [Chloroflexota bacterium]
MTKGGTPEQALERHYRRLQWKFVVKESGRYEPLVVPNGNASAPVHRWFHLKEAFSCDLLRQVVADTRLQNRSSIRVLDPFAGGGTTAVSLANLTAQRTLSRVTFHGFECNPFIQLVAAAKLTAMQAPSKTFERLAQKVAASAHCGTVKAPAAPELTTFHNKSYFDKKDLELLLRLREAIYEEECGGANQTDVALARLCLAAAVEPVSALRRDGRALRHVPAKVRASPIRTFLAHAERVAMDMPVERVPVRGHVHLGDGRTMSGLSSQAKFDLVIFSPPYPNNIDYTEVYKMEAWLLGMFENASTFKSQRLKTVHSHPSVRRNVENVELSQLADVVAPVLDAVPDDRYTSQRRAMIRGYARDMAQTLESAWSRLRPGGDLVYVVGNSLHGNEAQAFVIAADVIMAEMASRQGFMIERIDIARRLRRRHSESPFLRESVVFAKKPEH